MEGEPQCLPCIQPINPTRIAAPFDHADWFFELKHDGFRALAYIEGGGCKLISRKQIVYKRFAALSIATAGLPVKNAIMDVELVCLGGDGRSQFIQAKLQGKGRPKEHSQIILLPQADEPEQPEEQPKLGEPPIIHGCVN